MNYSDAPHHTVINRGRISKLGILSWKGSVLPVILPQVIVAASYAALAVLVDDSLYPIALPNSIVPSLSSVVGLLLVFATNSSYARHYEGRKLWSDLKTQGRNLVRYLRLFIPSNQQGKDYTALKAEAVKLTAAYLFSCKAFLREELEKGQPLEPLLQNLLPVSLLKEYSQSSENESCAPGFTSPCTISEIDSARKHLPSVIIFSLNKIIQQQNLGDGQCKGNIDNQCHKMMSAVLGSMVTTLTDLERIHTTAIPPAYKLHLVHTLGVYLIVLPLTLIRSAGYWAVLIQAAVAFTFFGISAIGCEIEKPFGYDANDLPLDHICREFYGEINSLTKRL